MLDIFEITTITDEVLNYYRDNLEIAINDYYKLTTNSRGLDKSNLIGYYEFHHKIPKCLGGIDCDENLVLLTYEEHIKAHMLLYIIYPFNYNLLNAFKFMITLSDKTFNKKELDKNIIINLNVLTEVKINYIKSISGDNNTSKDPEVRKKISNSLKIYYSTHEVVMSENKRNFYKKISGENSHFKRPEVRRKISESRKSQKIKDIFVGENNPAKRPEIKEKLSKIFNTDEYKVKRYGWIQSSDGTKYSSVKAAAEAEGVTPGTINDWIRKGKNGYKRIKDIL